MGALPRSRRHITGASPNGGAPGHRPWLARRQAAPHPNAVWIAEPYRALRTVLEESLLLEGLPARVITPARLVFELDSGVLPRGLMVDAAALETDPRLLATTHVVDRLAVSSSIPPRLCAPGLMTNLRPDVRWLQKPYALDELFATVRWLAEPMQPPAARWRDVS